MPKSPQEFILHTRNQLVSKEKMYFFAVAAFRQKEEVTELLVFTRWDFFVVERVCAKGQVEGIALGDFECCGIFVKEDCVKI
jgi:hypothetical protein